MDLLIEEFGAAPQDPRLAPLSTRPQLRLAA